MVSKDQKVIVVNAANKVNAVSLVLIQVNSGTVGPT